MARDDDFQRDPRPDADALLREIQREEKKRGRLKMFLGYAPGVGKTYAMLQEAHVLRNRGEDVVVGIVETHKRSETEALLAGPGDYPVAADRLQRHQTSRNGY